MKRRDLTRFWLIIAPLLSGCGGPPDDQDRERRAVIGSHPTANLNWLRTEDRIDPALWLASKEVSAGAIPSPEAIVRIRKALAEANDRFLETPRMIANRTAQLSNMLARDGQKESHADLIQSLAKIGEGSKGKLEYSGLCQQYYNLRHKGADKTATLATLTSKYRAFFRKP